ncbi:MAG: bifunctional oligoribonuclease/PAP phosphatase NrnA [Clostridia bacterium]|nr:bifunctional oligoribonuclease/PAP phosphatase NrnA [Clostridia bacterium]
MIKELSIKELAEKIKEQKYTLILCHKNPDPDTLGSAFALRDILALLGSCAKVASCDTAQKKFDFITEGVSLEYQENGYERYIAVDVASPTQLGELSFLADKVNLTIDHHKMCVRFSEYYENFCASCAENIYLLASELGILDKLPIHFYNCLYAGMSADTGGFRFSNVTPDTMTLASQIIAKGIDHAEINRVIFESKSLEEIKAQRLTYEKMQMFCDGALSLIVFTNRMKEENGISDADIGDVVNAVRSVEGVLVALSLKQSSKDEKKYSLSSRANADIDVSKGCMEFGGGGHVRAAGATVIADSEEEATNMVVSVFSHLIDEYKKGIKNG